MSSRFTKILIRQSILKLSKQKTKKIKFNNVEKNVEKKVPGKVPGKVPESIQKSWTMSKEKRLNIKKSWV